MTKLIEPKILRGTRDFLPIQMAKRQMIQDRIIDVFELFGYDRIDTPAIEYAQTLLGKYGDEGSRQLYRFKDNGSRDVALRFDQTVPTARLVAANYNELPMPFKRYQISKVWRADKPAKGRYREFTQCDIDIIGTKSLVAEAEVAAVIYKVFKVLGFPEFVIKVNSRRLINGILSSLGVVQDKQAAVIRALDKLNKIGQDGVKKELSTVMGVDKIDKLFSVVSVSGTNQEKLEKLKEYRIGEMKEFLDICQSYNIPENKLEFDVSLARGLDYYTGVIYEVFLPNVDIGAVCGGGRYDDLCGLFTNKEFSGVGVAFGFDRVVSVAEELGILKDNCLNSKVLVTYFDNDVLNNCLEIVTQLQQANINTEIYFEPAKLNKQLKYANKKRIPFVVICGPDEVSNESVTIKNMETGKQKTIPQNQISSYFNGYTNNGL